MMTQKELRAFYRDRAALRATEETLAGLWAYAAASDADLEQDIAALEETVRKQAAALTVRGTEVLSTLNAVEDICRRTELRLHYYEGMQWKEIATILGTSEGAICSRCSQALKKASRNDCPMNGHMANRERERDQPRKGTRKGTLPNGKGYVTFP